MLRAAGELHARYRLTRRQPRRPRLEAALIRLRDNHRAQRATSWLLAQLDGRILTLEDQRRAVQLAWEAAVSGAEPAGS